MDAEGGKKAPEAPEWKIEAQHLEWEKAPEKFTFHEKSSLDKFFVSRKYRQGASRVEIAALETSFDCSASEEKAFDVD